MAPEAPGANEYPDNLRALVERRGRSAEKKRKEKKDERMDGRRTNCEAADGVRQSEIVVRDIFRLW